MLYYLPLGVNLRFQAKRSFLQVRPYSKVSGQTLYLMGTDGRPPDPAVVEEACCNLGGVLMDRASGIEPQHCTPGDHKFSFSFLDRKWGSGWVGGRPSM